MKKFWKRCILMAAVAALLLSFPAYAYDYELDPVTGEPIGAGTDAKIYPMPDGSVFYFESRRYASQQSGVSYESTIPDGMVISFGETVSVWPGNGTSAEVYRNGDVVLDQDLQNIRQVGSYVVKISAKGSGANTSFRFTILPEIVNTMPQLALPNGFLLDYVLLDTIPQDMPFANIYQFHEDGKYEIRYSCAATNDHRTLRFTLDTQAPELVLNGVTKGEANGPVSFVFPSDADYVEINYEGDISLLRGGSKELRQPGTYQLTVYDKAGNSNVYPFIIQVYLDIGAGSAIALISVALIAIVIYSRYVRKNARVG